MNLALRLIQVLLRHRLVAGLLIVFSIAASLYAARTIEVRFQWRDFYEYEGNPRLPLLTRYTDDFGDPGGFVVMLLQGSDVFAPDVLRYIDAVTRKLETLEEFQKVRSLTNATAIRAAGDAVESGPIFSELPTTEEETRRLRDVALGSSLLIRRLVSPDGTATAVLAEMRTPAAFATIAQQQSAVNAMARVMRAEPPPAGVRIEVTGSPMVEVEVTKALVNDQLVLTPVVLLVLVTALSLTFRSIHGVLLPLVAVFVSMAWTAGIFSLLQRPIDIVGSTFPTILLVYGVVDPIFVYTRYLDKVPLFRTHEEAVIEAMRELLLPCFLTSLTTALGFAAFFTAALPMIKYFGLVVAIGVLFAFLTTVTVLPLLLVAVTPSHAPGDHSWISQKVDALVHWMWDTAKTKRELTIGIAISLLIIGAGAGRGLEISTEYVGTLPKGRVQNSVRTLEEKLSGVVRVAVYLEGEADTLKRPDVLRAIEALDRLAEQQPTVTSSISLADLVADSNRAFAGGTADEQRVPESEELISQYLTFVDPTDLSDFVNSDYSRSHVQILVSDHGSRSVWQLQDVLQREIDAHLTPLGVRASITGSGVVSYHDGDGVVREVLWGFLIAFGLIVFVQLVMFRSLRIALISIIPNLVPICICFLLMRATGMNLRVDNSLVLCVSVGGLFNTTIHIVARIVQQLRSGEDEPDVIVGRALAAVGPPSLYTAAILSLGFSAMYLSRFPGLQALGLLCLVTLMSGFFADALLTTTFFRSFFNWESTDLAVRRPAEANLNAMARADEEAV